MSSCAANVLTRAASAAARVRSFALTMVPWVRICQVVKGALGRKVLSIKTTTGRYTEHAQGTRMYASGERIIDGVLARSRDAPAELKLAACGAQA